MKPILKTTNLNIGYRAARKQRRSIAENLNLTIYAGELICLLGANGTGKSTLMRTLAGMQPALAGTVTLTGDDISRLKPRDMATRLSVVLTERPNVGLLDGYSLVALGRHPYTDWTGHLAEHDKSIVMWAVDVAGASAFAHYPVMELSDGQQQKLMIARALAQESELILLDEPTAFLDLPHRVEIMRLLKQLAHDTGRAILLSTHDLHLALRSADTLWLMANGEIQTGTPEDLVLNGAFEAAFQREGMQFDRATGSFSVMRESKKRIAIAGDGIVQTWTQRALTRAGFTPVSPGEDVSMCIEIAGSETQPEWILHTEATVTRYESIGALLAGLSILMSKTNSLDY